MCNPEHIVGNFERHALTALKEKMPVPLGWFVLPYRLMQKKEDRRKYHGKWFTIISEHKKIYRVLRFAPSLSGTTGSTQKEIILDWVGWIDLCGRDEDVDIILELRIRKTYFWEFVSAGLKHPEPIYRLSTGLAIISVGLGLLSVVITCILQ